MKKLIALFTLALSLTALAQPYHGNRGNRPHGPHGNTSYGPQAPQRLFLDINQEFQGMSVIPLKMRLKQQYPSLILKDLKLREVVVVAKSRMGGGTVSLVVGQSISPGYRVDGNPRSYASNHPRTFGRIRLQSNAYDSSGKWQIELKGNIKVRQIAVIVEQDTSFGGGGLVLDMNGRMLMGASTIHLKMELMKVYGQLNLSQAKLESVTVFTKSKFGLGKVQLQVGSQLSFPMTIPGNPYSFQNNFPGSFVPVQLFNQSYSSVGPWMLKLNGNIKVDKIVLKISGLNGGWH